MIIHATRTWAAERRLDYIDWCLATRGEVHRGDLMTLFEVTSGSATRDFRLFLSLYRALSYDKTRKRYVPRRLPYEPRRRNGWTAAIDWARAPKRKGT